MAASRDFVKALLGIWGDADFQNQVEGIVRNKAIYQKVAIAMAELGYSRTWRHANLPVAQRPEHRHEKEIHLFSPCYMIVTLTCQWHMRSRVCPNATVQKYYISRKAQFYVCGDYFVPHFVNPAVILMYAANAALDRSGDLRSRITRVYSVKPSSMVTTNCDTENHVFLSTHSDLYEVRL